MASTEVVVVDADVLIPILSCDFLLTGLDLAVYELAVSPKVLDEVEQLGIRFGGRHRQASLGSVGHVGAVDR